MLRKLAAHATLLSAVAYLWVIASAVASVQFQNWLWFQRSGSMLTLAAALLAARAIVRLGRDGALPAPAFEVGQVLGSSIGPDGGVRVQIKRDPKHVVREREQKRDANAAARALVLGVLGTLIWGYGDLLGLL